MDILNEINHKLCLVEKLINIVNKPETQSVQELQLLLKDELWVLGPEFDSCEFISDKAMNKAIQKIVETKDETMNDRHDFVLLPNSSGSVSAYGCYSYDAEGKEQGIGKVVILEILRPGISVGCNEKHRCWEYVKELFITGVILPSAVVSGYILGSNIDSLESSSVIHWDKAVSIIPLLFETVIKRTDARLSNLRERVQK